MQDTCEKHDGCVVVYESQGSGRTLDCPMCELQEKVDALREDVERLNEELDTAKDDVENLQKELDQKNEQA